MIKINGRETAECEGRTVAQLLTMLEYKTDYIAVEINGSIIKKADYTNTVLRENDSIEIVCFVGGG